MKSKTSVVDELARLLAGYNRNGFSIFSTPKRRDWLWGPPKLPFNECLRFSPGMKRLGPEDNYSPPSSTEVKNMWIYDSTSPHNFLACTGSSLLRIDG